MFSLMRSKVTINGMEIDGFRGEGDIEINLHKASVEERVLEGSDETVNQLVITLPHGTYILSMTEEGLRKFKSNYPEHFKED